jgi:hypothetical protein
MMLTGLILILVWYLTTTSHAICFHNYDVVVRAACGSRYDFFQPMNLKGGSQD